MKLTIRKKILLCSLVPLLLLGAIIIILASTLVRSSIIDQVKNSLKGTSIATLAAYDQNAGSYLEAENGDIWKGSYNISQSENLVDTIKSESGMEVTFFYGSKRIMTSALDKDGNRILGSPAGQVVTDQVLKKGKGYFSDNVSIDGTIYYGYYTPLYQKGDKSVPIGMVFAGLEKAPTLHSVLNIINMIVGIVFVVIIVCVIIVQICAASITSALKKSIQSVQDVSSGNLHVAIDKKNLKRSDEIGDLSKAINNLQSELLKIIGGIKESTSLLVQSSDVLEQTSHQTYSGISEVQSTVSTITDGATQQANDTKNASDNIQYMGNLITETGKEADELNESADTMKAASDAASATIDELKKISLEVKDAIRKLGSVNVNAIEEYKEISERHAFLDAQHTDLVKAAETLQGIIDELDAGMRKQFTEKFEEIRKEFDRVFRQLFGGGKGTLELEEDTDVLEAGIRIISQPPGKKLQNMMQMSGGEKSLTAISLLFAIQNLKPSPFCLLDEIEAALDDSNVTRFAQYLHKLTKNTQFIVITHRRGTMTAADRLYGITMQEKGVSTLVSVDLIEGELDK